MLTAYEFLSSSSSIIDDARRQILGGEKKARLGTTIQKMQAYCRRKRGIFRICLPSKNCFAFPISSNGTYINRFRRREREKIEALEGKVLETSI